MSKDIQVSIKDGVQVIRMHRPDKKNALTLDMYAAMSEALAGGDKSPDVSAHVFMGCNGVYTAGNDIGDFARRSTGGGGGGGGTSLNTTTTGFIRSLPTVKKPMIAAVDGLAIGIGTTMIFHCDMVFASPTAVFRTPFLDLGLVPEAGSSLLGPMRMGYARAFELLVMGDPFDAKRAEAAGLVNHVVPAAELEAAALMAAKRLAAKPPGALAHARRLLRGDPSAIVAQIDKEVALFGELLTSPEAKEAFAAFAEKRAPDFSRFPK